MMPKQDGTMCDDGNACTYGERCQAGTCVAGGTVTCTTPGDACHETAVCDPQSGACVNPPKPDGTPCADADQCTQTDTCQAGTCTGGDPIVCEPPTPCHTATCKPRSGKCKVRKVERFKQCKRDLRGGDRRLR
jgi:hypothetical protein